MEILLNSNVVNTKDNNKRNLSIFVYHVEYLDLGRRKIIGTCRLCGVKSELTFEHIPPKFAFNRNTGYTVSTIVDAIEALEDSEANSKAKRKQGGIGNISLCTKCNEFLGQNYVDAYTNWAKTGIQVLKTPGEVYDYVMENIEPLKIIKQIFSMFISMEDELCYKRYRELCDFVRNPGETVLSEKYQIHTYLNKEATVVYIPFTVTANFKSGISIPCTELTFIPYGYVFTLDYSNAISNLVNITTFKNYKLDEKANIGFYGMHLLPNYIPFPLDYRTKEEIADTIQQSKNYKKNRD